MNGGRPEKVPFRDATPPLRGPSIKCNHERSRVRNVKIDTRREKPWFIDRKTSSSWEEGKRRSPMTQDEEGILEPFRKYLKVLAELHLDRRLRGKLDPSDVVQQTMLRAYSAFSELRDARPEVVVAWLRRILARTLADAVKHYERDKSGRWAGAFAGGRTGPIRVGVRRLAGRRPDLAQRPGRAERGTAPDGRGAVGVARVDARGGRVEALPGLDAPEDRRADRPDGPVGGVIAAPGAGGTAERLKPGGDRDDAERSHDVARRRSTRSSPPT